ncbi:toprim domain-containing protein [Acinetobacter populi]|uniref:Toprim n=1 Tax=Acinetobacter populi TaxID=1582270 RepID=A0A1Z9Z2M6_9GAMM|nr:toprim domain-containing protein [Acinetobacter populi]OUY08733.1 toprim [Acinetobacter populi]
MSDISRRIDDRLNQIFKFKRQGEWYREGICPQCSKKECYTHAIKPRIVKCGRLNKCGYEEHVKDICEDLFKDWSKEFPKTDINPHAAADAYLKHGRGFDLTQLKGLYTQETFSNEKKYPGLYTGTVRFKIAEGVYWERFIDRPERFGRQKANFIGKYEGLAWSLLDLDNLCKAQSIWISEGIFNSIALVHSGQAAIASMSTSNYPSKLLKQIEDRCHELKIDKPRLIWAFDNDKAGKDAIKKFHIRALQQKWSSSAALPPYQVKGRNFDWNDLFLHDLLHSEERVKYRHYGELLIAETAEQAGLLIYNFKEGRTKTFFFNHNLRLYWFNLDYDKYSKRLEQIEKEPSFLEMLDEKKREQALRDSAAVTEICNAQIEPLYFERNEVTGESWYYFNMQSQWAEKKTQFTASEIGSRSKFKDATMQIMAGAMWTGTDQQLEFFIKRKTERLKEVKTTDFIGYSSEYRTYIFPQHAVHDGQIIGINEHDYFKIKRLELKSLAKSPVITINPKKEFKPTWWKDFYRVRGCKGLITLAWWTGSYFAEQIRSIHSSYPFIEIVGEAGAGKSRLIEFLWKLSGRENYEGFDANKATSVAVYRNFAQISNLPVVLIEGDRNDQQGNSVKQAKFSWDELKDAFNGRAIRSKGIKNAGNETYEPPFRGAIMISQNTSIAASEAILTRTLHLFFDRKGQSLETKRIVDTLDRMDLEDTCTYMTHCLRKENEILQTYQDRLKSIEDQYHSAGITHTRIALCHAQVAALVEALAEHVLDGVLDYEEVAKAQDMLMEMAQARVDQLNGDCKEVEQFWEAFEYLQSGRSAQFSLNHHDHDAQTVAINLNEIYKVAAQHYQKLPDITLIKDLLKTSQKYKFIETNRAVSSNRYPADASKNVDADNEVSDRRRTVKCWIFTNPNLLQAKGK